MTSYTFDLNKVIMEMKKSSDVLCKKATMNIPKVDTYIISNPKLTAAHITTIASIIFQNSLRYEPGCKTTPRSTIFSNISIVNTPVNA